MLTPENFTCDNAMELLDDFRRGTLDPYMLVLVGEHLKQCDNCAEELRLRNATAEWLTQSLPLATAPKALPATVRHAIDTAAPGAAGRKPGRLLPLMLSAAAVITIMVAILQLRAPSPVPLHTTVATSPDARAKMQRETAPAMTSREAFSASDATEPAESFSDETEEAPAGRRFGAMPPALSRSAMPVMDDMVATTATTASAAADLTTRAAAAHTTATAVTTVPAAAVQTTSSLQP